MHRFFFGEGEGGGGGEEEKNGLVMLRIWYSFRKMVKVSDGILEVYSLSLIRFDGIGDNIGENMNKIEIVVIIFLTYRYIRKIHYHFLILCFFVSFFTQKSFLCK